MKNSQSNTEAVVSTTNKAKAQHVAVTAVKVLVYPAHLVCQTAADILNISQATIVNKIDKTPVFEAMMDQVTWSQNQQAKVVNQYLKVQAKIDAQREANRQQDIDRLKAKLDAAEGVEQMPEPIFIPINKRGPKSEVTPLMTPQVAFQ